MTTTTSWLEQTLDGIYELLEAENVSNREVLEHIQVMLKESYKNGAQAQATKVQALERRSGGESLAPSPR